MTGDTPVRTLDTMVLDSAAEVSTTPAAATATNAQSSVADLRNPTLISGSSQGLEGQAEPSIATTTSTMGSSIGDERASLSSASTVIARVADKIAGSMGEFADKVKNFKPLANINTETSTSDLEDAVLDSEPAGKVGDSLQSPLNFIPARTSGTLSIGGITTGTAASGNPGFGSSGLESEVAAKSLGFVISRFAAAKSILAKLKNEIELGKLNLKEIIETIKGIQEALDQNIGEGSRKVPLLDQIMAKSNSTERPADGQEKNAEKVREEEQGETDSERGLLAG